MPKIDSELHNYFAISPNNTGVYYSLISNMYLGTAYAEASTFYMDCQL